MCVEDNIIRIHYILSNFRHAYTPINIDYRYRFQAPQHDTYEVSGVNFTTEKLENFNWNYMDQYICTRGDTDYPLQEVSSNLNNLLYGFNELCYEKLK